MRKKLGLISIAFLVFACAKDHVPDCIQKGGSRIFVEHHLDTFDQILVNENIELIIQEGSNHHVKIEAGEYLISDVNFTINEGLLTLTDNNQCNWLRSYQPTKITVTTPSLYQIRSNTQYTIKSSGKLNFPNLKLVSENFNQDQISLGDFDLEVNNQSLSIISNNLSQFFISGHTETLFVGFYSGTTAFFGDHLIAQNVTVSHRSSHDIRVHPIQSLSGELRGVGNLISVHTPPIVDITQLYTGSLIFLD